MKTKRQYLLKGLKIFLGLIVVIFAAIFIYVSVNKKQIIATVISDIEAKLNGDLTVGKVELSFLRNFPSVSVLLHDVSLKDTMYATHQHSIFKAKEVFANLAISRLISKGPPLKGLRIDQGELYLFTDSTGYTNTYLLKGKKNATGSKARAKGSDLKKIELNNVRVVLDDQSRKKFHNVLVNHIKIKVDDGAEKMELSSKTDLVIKSLGFNTQRGTFLNEKSLTGNFKVNIDKLTNQLFFDNIRVKISGQPFDLTGRFDLGGGHGKFMLNVASRNIEYAFIKSLLPARISKSLSIVELDKPLDVKAQLSGSKGIEPLVNASWTAKKTILKTPFLDFDDATFSGTFTNEVVAGVPRKDPNSRVVISGFTATWHEMPVKANSIAINNLTTPELAADLSTTFELTQLNHLIGNSIKLNKGTGEVRLNYKGPIVRNNNTNSFLNGDITFKDGNITYAPRDVEMKDVQSRIVFRNSDVIVENLQTNVAGQSIRMQGQAKNLLTLINTEPDKANIDWNIYLPSLDLQAFTYLLRSRKQTISSGDKNITQTAAKIDRMLEAGRLHVSLKADRLAYKNFNASNVIADITLLNDRYVLNKVAMNHAGGTMDMSGSLLNKNKLHQASVVVNMNNVDVSTMLAAFNNFGQDGITAKNLEGKLTTRADASLFIDTEGKVIPSSLTGIVDFSLKNGALNNYEPIKKLQTFVFKNRDFENIRFAELKDRLEIKNREIKINRMEIQSTVMSMYVEGLYSQIGNTDMSIQVPLSNLKKRSADFNPENLGADKKGGGSIYIRGRPGPDGNIKFKLDLFNKFDKKDKAGI